MRQFVEAIIKTIALIALGSAATAAVAAPDPTKGKVIFARCSICHSVDSNAPKMGPSLGGVIGRKAGSVANYNYSAAMSVSRITWNEATINAFITAPQSVVKGTKMAFPGLASAPDRADLIAYLKTTKPLK